MCRYFPAGATILKTISDHTQEIFVAVAEYRGQYTIALVNTGDQDKKIKLTMPSIMDKASLYVYEENHRPVNVSGCPVPVIPDMSIHKVYQTALKAQSFRLITNME
jgi:hypothetical protein